MTNPLDLEEIKGLMAKVSAEPVLDAGDGPFAELWEGDFNAGLAAVATLIKQHERMADDVRIWKREAEERSQRMVELNLDRAAQGVTIMQLREALKVAEKRLWIATTNLETIEGRTRGDEKRLQDVRADIAQARSALNQQEETNG